MERSCVFLPRCTSQSRSPVTLGNLWTFGRLSPSLSRTVIRSSSDGLLARGVSPCIWGSGDRLGIASSPPRSLLGSPNVPFWWHIWTSNYVKMTLCRFVTETHNRTLSSLSSRQHNTTLKLHTFRSLLHTAITNNAKLVCTSRQLSQQISLVMNKAITSNLSTMQALVAYHIPNTRHTKT